MKQAKQLSPYVNDKTPAFASLVIKNGETVFKGVQGCAVLENGKCVSEATLDTPFAICSVTKHLTAAAILLLEEAGKLSIDDLITQHLSFLPSKFNGIKIKHLIFHTSGIPDYFMSNPAVIDFNHIIKEGKTLDEALILQNILQTEPQGHDQVFLYSNSGYALLAQIVQKISGLTFDQFMKIYCFDPLGMNHTFMLSELHAHSHYAIPYSAWPLYLPTNWMQAITTSGEGGLLMSINDMEKWLHALIQSRIFKKQHTMEKFLSVGQHDNGKEVVVGGQVTYGFGLGHTDEQKNGKKYRSFNHSGGMPGSTALFGNFSNNEQNVWVAYFNNANSYPSLHDILEQLNVDY